MSKISAFKSINCCAITILIKLLYSNSSQSTVRLLKIKVRHLKNNKN